ncbi:hypothetical protein HOC13_02990 [Candidatus Woesearchaeota archaeon]|jgi:hypothetical protein|nr:hypothetical protein [Candidatus Woesearchaeota archaeon]
MIDLQTFPVPFWALEGFKLEKETTSGRKLVYSIGSIPSPEDSTGFVKYHAQTIEDVVGNMAVSLSSNGQDIYFAKYRNRQITSRKILVEDIEDNNPAYENLLKKSVAALSKAAVDFVNDPQKGSEIWKSLGEPFESLPEENVVSPSEILEEKISFGINILLGGTNYYFGSKDGVSLSEKEKTDMVRKASDFVSEFFNLFPVSEIESGIRNYY